MTLEDFFTLTEMKDGLTAPSRVEELVAVMHNDKDCVVKNVGDATRQWAAVASTIEATENKDCLELFIQLNGLWFIDRWLKDAHKFSNDATDGFAEESITALLRALEKLQIDMERSVSSGIWITVNNLLDHNSSRVQDRARALFARWKKDKISGAHGVGDQIDDTIPAVLPNEKGGVEHVAVDTHISEGNPDVEKDALEAVRDEILKPTSPVSLQKEKDEVQKHTGSSEVRTSSDLGLRNVEDRSPDPVFITNTAQDNSSNGKSSLGVAEATTSTDDPSFAGPGHSTDLKLEASDRLSDVSEKPGLLIPCSSKVETEATSCAEAASAQDTARESIQPMDVDVSVSEFCTKNNASGDPGTSLSASGVAVDVNGVEVGWKSTNNDTESCPENLKESSTKEGILEKLANFSTPHSHSEDSADDVDREYSSPGAEDSGDDSEFSNPVTNILSVVQTENRSSEIDLEYGIVDALEVARQVAQEVAREVAQEVEREVVDYREPSCSSSFVLTMKDIVGQAGMPDSNGARHDQSANIPVEALLARQHDSSGEVNSQNVDNQAEYGTLDSSQVTELAQEPEVNAEKGLCGFDLNQEVSSEDVERLVNPASAPVSVVSASRPVATSGSPSAPLQFEGALGWKGCAATSAFRPASLRKTSDGDKSLETGGTGSSSKQRLCVLDFDLNVVDGDEKTAGLVPVSSRPQSVESSLEVGSRKSERPCLDLNLVDDDGDAPLELKMERESFYPPNGPRSASPTSSSSSIQQLRNFDLNDRPLLPNDPLDQGLSLGNSSLNFGALKGLKPEDLAISLMGTKVEVGNRQDSWRKDFIPPAPSLSNGKSLEPAIDTNMARFGGILGMVPTATYTHSPVFAYGGLTATPAIATSSSLYGPSGPFSYTVDSRGAPVLHQLMGTPTPVPPYSQQFIMGMTTGATIGLNGAGPSRPSFDLNSGFSFDASSNGGLRQFLLPSQGRNVEEQIRSTSHPSSSGVGEKRKEPDGGWEPFSLHYKPQQPWR